MLQDKMNRYEELWKQKTCSAKEFSKIMGVSEHKARQLMRMEGFPVITIGRNKRVLLSKVDEFLEGLIGAVL
ncbi:DNA-binding protein [uncultured Clostridium sp.]|uniref:DNA-binding protein n=1 Tax=uncultured Clostridium sp. TaxID=59620 RepID=UPI0025D0919A|nr:DNA-binding protein [uncultured Clostridium sp.]